MDNLLGMVQEYAQKLINDDNSVPAEKKELTAQHLAGSLVDELKDQVAKGNITQLLDIFSKKDTTVGAPAMNNIQNSVVSSLAQKVGLSSSSASSLVSSILPSIMGLLGKKASDPNDKSLDFNSLLGMLGGNGGFDFNSIMNKLDTDHDGFGLDDVTRLFSQGGEGGGILGTLGKLFGK